MPTDEHPDGELPPALLEAALERLYAVPAAERAAAAASLSAEHPAHSAALANLLARIEGAERLLDRTFPEVDDESPATIGGLPVLRRLGAGSFGVVYLCEQTTPVLRRVAVKVLRPGVGDRYVLRRFAAEQQLLAALNHAAITHVYDAGHLPDGRPYFVMEYVEGLPLTTYCEQHQLDREARLVLFVALCRGVAYAHERGIVHRDLKPANVLVVARDEGPQPKIIDFGIAKAVSAELAAIAAPATDTGRVIGTPGYMSPEQARGQSEQIDGRADVFALGVMLHELLTGELPWPGGVVAAETPRLPSASLRHQARTAAGARGSELRREASAVRGDLDWITYQATRYEPEARYATVRDLAADVERHLAGLVVQAGPPTWRYRAAKFYRRHRLGMVLAGAALLCSGLGAAYAWQQRGSSVAHFAAATAAVELLLQRASDARLQEDGPNEAIRMALAADALAFYERWLRERPSDPALRLGRCQALVLLSRVYWEIGRGDEALQVAVQAGDESAPLLAAPAPSLAVRTVAAAALRHRARAAALLAQWPDAAVWSRRAVAALEDCYRDDPPACALSLSAAHRERGTSEFAVGQPEAGFAAYARSIEVLEALLARGVQLDEGRADLVSARLALAQAETTAGRLDAAEATLAHAASGLEQLTVDRWRPTAAIHLQQARLAVARKDAAASRDRFARAIDSCARWCEREPRQQRARTLLVACFEEAVQERSAALDWAAADQRMAQALAAVDRLPEAAVEARRLRFWFARLTWDRFRRPDLPQARQWLAEVVAGDVREAPSPGTRPLHWEVATLAALCDDAALGLDSGAVARWAAVAAQLPTAAPESAPELANSVVEGWLGVARARLGGGDVDGAAAALAKVDAVLATWAAIGKDYRSQLAWCRAAVALQRGDVAAVAAPLAELLQLRPSWWGRSRAAALELGCWRLRRDHEAELANAHRDAATDLCRRAIAALAPLVAAAPLDPWVVVPWGQVQLDLAELEQARGEHAAALARLEEALPALSAVAALAHADQWDAARLAAAEARRTQLRAELGR